MTFDDDDCVDIQAALATIEGGSGEDGISEARFRVWWAHLPDFVKPDYPLDIPPERLPFARHVFTDVGAPRACPAAACRRAGACQGGDGPPCFRAARRDLSQVLFLWWLTLFYEFPEEDYAAALRARGNRYAPHAPPATRARRRRRR